MGVAAGLRDLKSKREVLSGLEGPGQNLAGVKGPREGSWSRTESGPQEEGSAWVRPQKLECGGCRPGASPQGHLVVCGWEASPARLSRALGGAREVLGRRGLGGGGLTPAWLFSAATGPKQLRFKNKTGF